jgi:3-methyladenine DNA glycosylase AlkD
MHFDKGEMSVIAGRWERRTAIVSRLYFIGKGDVDDAFKIAEILLNDDQALIHKATGGAFREAGKKIAINYCDFWTNMLPRYHVRLCDMT